MSAQIIPGYKLPVAEAAPSEDEQPGAVEVKTTRKPLAAKPENPPAKIAPSLENKADDPISITDLFSFSQKDLVKGLIFSEILAKPLSKRRRW